MPKDTKVAAFYCEVTALEDPIWTYYMACGWHRGYFGMQVNSPTERRIIFSVWDSGSKPQNRGKVADEDRVTLVAKGEGVDAGDFGGEGTGGHGPPLVYPWKTGEKQRFLVTAKPVDDSHTVFSGYYFHPDKQQWMLISSWKAPKEGGYLRRLYSFSENFGGANSQLRRKALYGNQWIRSSDGKWLELTTATFTATTRRAAVTGWTVLWGSRGKALLSSRRAALCLGSRPSARSSAARLLAIRLLTSKTYCDRPGSRVPRPSHRALTPVVREPSL